MHPTASGEHNHGGTAIQGIASCHHLPPRLEEVCLTCCTLTYLGGKRGRGGRRRKERGKKMGKEKGGREGNEEEGGGG